MNWQGERILYVGLYCGSRMQGFSCPISLESLGSPRYEGLDKEMFSASSQ